MDVNLQTTLFYTMSTVAQTLSGAMGLIGAIVLFALQGTARRIERAAERMLEVPHMESSTVLLRHLFARRSFRELARQYGAYLEPGPGRETNVFLLEHHSALMWELEHDAMLRSSFWTALLASGAVISLALVACAFATQLAMRPTAGRAVLGTLIAGALGCLLLYGVLLRIMLATPDQKRASRAES